MRRRSNNMLEGPLLPSIISYAIPVFFTGILQLIFNAADLIVVGQYGSPNSVAAVGATGSLTILMVNFFMGFSIGSGANMANAIGRRDSEMMHKIPHTALAVALTCGAVLTVVGVFMSETFLTWMGTHPNVLPLSAVYMRIYFGGVLFTMVYNFAASILRAAGDTKSPLAFLSLAGVVNVLLNLLFVIVLHMDVAGVALATTISQGIAAVLTVGVLMRRTDESRLHLRKIRFHKTALLRIIRQGLPAGFQNSLFSISNVLIQSSINSLSTTLGEAVIAGHSAAASIDGFIYTGMDSLAQTSINFTGQNAGAGQYKRVRRILWTCMGCVTVLGLFLSSVAYLFAQPLLSMYVPGSPDAIKFGVIRLTYLGLPYFLCGIMNVCTGSLRGMQLSLLPMFISVLGVCGMRIVWVYTVFQVPQFHTLESLYCSYPISWILTAGVELVACLWFYRKRQMKHEGGPLTKEGG